MSPRQDNPFIPMFNFGTDSIFNNIADKNNTMIPIVSNDFLLLDAELFNLLDGTQLLLLGG